MRNAGTGQYDLALGQVASQTRYLAPWEPEAYVGVT
jgi:hypothetical protein